MGLRSGRLRTWQRGPIATLSLLACLALAACGPLGDDDPEPTATESSISQPTEAATESAGDVVTEAAGANETPSSNDAGTPPAPVIVPGTPDLEPVSGTAETAQDATPVFNGVVATSVENTATPITESQGTPVPAILGTPQAEGPVLDGDGTSGPLPAENGATEETPVVVEESPESATGTPVASPVASAASLGDLEVVQATSCEPEVIPQADLASTSYRTTDDVNIRFGPGTDCELLAISPLGPFMPVLIESGPVQREGEDFVWVQVQVTSGDIGWVVTEALEPIEP